MSTTTHQTTSTSRRRAFIQSFNSKRERLSYLWLALAIVLLPFGTLRWTIPLAAWLSPIFLLRFLRTQPLLRGILLVLLAIVLVLEFELPGFMSVSGALYILLVFGIGVILVAWYRGEALADLVVYLAWSLSGPVGAIVAVLGAALVAPVPRRSFWLMLAGGVVVITWDAGVQVLDSPLVPELFGVGGILIVAFFLGLLWDWARSRPGRSAAEQAGGDLQMVGNVFSLVAA